MLCHLLECGWRRVDSWGSGARVASDNASLYPLTTTRPDLTLGWGREWPSSRHSLAGLRCCRLHRFDPIQMIPFTSPASSAGFGSWLAITFSLDSRVGRRQTIDNSFIHSPHAHTWSKDTGKIILFTVFRFHQLIDVNDDDVLFYSLTKLECII